MSDVARCVIKTKILKSHSTLEYFIHITLPFSQGKNAFFFTETRSKTRAFSTMYFSIFVVIGYIESRSNYRNYVTTFIFQSASLRENHDTGIKMKTNKTRALYGKM